MTERESKLNGKSSIKEGEKSRGDVNARNMHEQRMLPILPKRRPGESDQAYWGRINFKNTVLWIMASRQF